jgi:hypothetical protein
LRYILLFLILISHNVYSQSLLGTSGLLNVPDAEIRDKNVAIGGVYFPNKNIYDIKYNNDIVDKEYTFVYFVSVGFLPFLEVSFRGVKVGAEIEGIGDRMFNAKIKILKENNYLPNLSIGINDLIKTVKDVQTRNFHSAYLVVDKNINILFPSKLILGYGHKLLNARNTLLNGVFGGVNINLLEPINALLEYDSNNINFAVFFTPFSFTELGFIVYDTKYIGYKINLMYKL